MFNPRKHTPATVEFADVAGSSGTQTGAQALLDLAPFRNADALLHVVRMFRDPSVPHPTGTIDAARDVRAMEDEVILADLGVVERRLERLERDIKKGQHCRSRQGARHPPPLQDRARSRPASSCARPDRG